jgi:hypothetical protein
MSAVSLLGLSLILCLIVIYSVYAIVHSKKKKRFHNRRKPSSLR